MKEAQTSPQNTIVHLCESGVVKPALCENRLTIICMYCLAAEIVRAEEALAISEALLSLARRRLAAAKRGEGAE